jgi:hypothetical protein
MQAPCPHGAKQSGQNGRRKTFFLGSMHTGRFRGKPAPTHIMNNIRCAEALSLYEGKNTIFCASNVVLVQNCLSMQGIETRQEPLVDRWAEKLHWKRFQRKGLPKVTLQNGFTQS